MEDKISEKRKFKNMMKSIMSGKFFLYIIVTILVIWAMDSVNINQIFKNPNNSLQA